MKMLSRSFAACTLFIVLVGFISPPPVAAEDPKPKRKFFEYKGNYAQEIQDLKDKFKAAYGYDLEGLGEAWTHDEIKRMHAAFAELPPSFYRLPGLKGLYRLIEFMAQPGSFAPDEIPAATLPTYVTIHKSQLKSYKVFIEDQDLRIEFYNPLFYEDPEDFRNIVHHEMSHAFDMAHGFISFSGEWLAISGFKTLNLPALDGKEGDDFLYTFLNRPEIDNYAPVSRRHLPTYSRQNLQEDFANSVAAYIHYPYFRYSHPARYQFLKERVFMGKEYFKDKAQGGTFEEVVLADFNDALERKNWEQAVRVLIEVSRGYYPKLEKQLVAALNGVLKDNPSREWDPILGMGSCYLQAPEALELRKTLIREKRVTVKELLKNERCFRMGRDNFQKNLAKWAPANVYFFREDGHNRLQFLDPALPVAHARGYNSRYLWRLTMDGMRGPLAEGSHMVTQGGNGSVAIDLKQSSGTDLVLPPNRVVNLELGVQRMHPKRFQKFESQIATVRFKAAPWFEYIGPDAPEVSVIYPPSLSAAIKRD